MSHDHSKFDHSWSLPDWPFHDQFTINHDKVLCSHSLNPHSIWSSHEHWRPDLPLSLRLNLEMWSTSCNMSIVQVTITTRFYSSWAFKNIYHRISHGNFEALFTWPPVALFQNLMRKLFLKLIKNYKKHLQWLSSKELCYSKCSSSWRPSWK